MHLTPSNRRASKRRRGTSFAEMAIDGLWFFVVDENPEAFNLSPKSLDGTTVRINLIVDDPDADCLEGGWIAVA
jgi:hypothetical protein